MKRIALAVLAVAIACSPDNSKNGSTDTAAAQRTGSVDLTGAGATFPYPLYSKWFADYAAKTGVKINYQSIGSGGGIRQISEQTVDFGATDGPMNPEELSHAKGGAILHIPTVLGGVVITYNLPEVTQPLKLTASSCRTTTYWSCTGRTEVEPPTSSLTI